MEDYRTESRQQLKARLATIAALVADTRRLTPQLRKEQAALIDDLNNERIDTLEYADRYWEYEQEIRAAERYSHAWEAGLLLDLPDNSEQGATAELMVKRLDLMNRAHECPNNPAGHE